MEYIINKTIERNFRINCGNRQMYEIRINIEYIRILYLQIEYIAIDSDKLMRK